MVAVADASIIAVTAEKIALTNMIATINDPPQAAPVLGPFQWNILLNLPIQAATQAYSDVLAPMKDEWNGKV